MRRGSWITLILLIIGSGGLSLTLRAPVEEPVDPYAVIGAPKLARAYQAWEKWHEEAGGDRNVELALAYSKAFAKEFSEAAGRVRLDLLDGKVDARVRGLPHGEYDLWLVDNRPGESTSSEPEASDGRILAGRFTAAKSDDLYLTAELGAQAFAAFHVDLVVLSRAGDGPEQGLLHGTSSLFQRVYTATRTPQLLASSDFGGPTRDRLFQIGTALAQEPIVDVVSTPAPITGAPVQAPTNGAITDGATNAGTDALRGGGGGGGDVLAQIAVSRDVLFSALIQRGANLFIRETFRGNGRTCATCHPIARNTQLNLGDIASLPDSDPLFAAEFVPALAFTPAGPKFEVPVLMRGAALIVENVDGMDDLMNKFAMRSIPHTLALTTSLRPSVGPDGTTVPPNQRTGWSGDGAPNPGALRNFATGAVIQHFPKTLGRRNGTDFRLPTDAELDAMEAFQLSLGRDRDLVLPLALRDPFVVRGQTVFLGVGRCNVCHLNAGANTTIAADATGNGGNRNFDTGVEDRLIIVNGVTLEIDQAAQVILTAQTPPLDITPNFPDNLFPRDGGFGAMGDEAGGPGSPVTGFGNGTFNTPPVVEAADTGPFFHNNQVRTIEAAVAFYNGAGFNNSPSGRVAPINLQPPQVEQVAMFLRAINALENIRAARELADTVRNLRQGDRNRVGAPLLRQASSEITDAVNVLTGADLHPRAVSQLRMALSRIRPPDGGIRTDVGAAVVQLLDQARADIIR